MSVVRTFACLRRRFAHAATLCTVTGQCPLNVNELVCSLVVKIFLLFEATKDVQGTGLFAVHNMQERIYFCLFPRF